MDKIAKLHLAEFFALAGVFLGCFIFLLHRIDALEAKQDVRIQAQMEMSLQISQRIDAQSARSDRLYEIVIELLKERKNS